MKSFLKLLIITSIALSSCSSVEFKEVTPKKGKELKKFPKELIGSYIDNQYKDTLIITKNGFQYGNEALFSLQKELKDEFAVLKKMNDYFILNVKNDEAKNWGVIPFKYENDKIEVYFLMLDKDTEDVEEAKKFKKEILKKLSDLTEVEVVPDSITENKNYLINPTDKEMEKMLSNGFFLKILDFKRIK